MPSNQPVVLLRDVESSRYLPIWVGTVEATAIAFALEGVTPPRPMTHDLIGELVKLFGDTLASVHITDLDDGVFYANLVFESGRQLACRPSDAIAVALRVGADIKGAESVLDEAAIDIEESSESSSDVPEEQQLQEFREFLDHVTPEDFETGSES
jgi:hypothetical protein